MGGIGRLGAGLAALVTGALAGCSTPGAPASPDPARFLLAEAGEPCRVVFGPLSPDGSFGFDEVGQLDTPDGPTFLGRGFVFTDRDAADFDVGGIGVSLSTFEGVVSASWELPPTSVGFETRSLDEDELRALLPELVATADTASLGRVLAEHIDGAEVAYAGRAPEYDVGLAYDDAMLTLAGRGVTPERLDAYYGRLHGERDGSAWLVAGLGGTDGRASGAAVVVGRSPGAASSASAADFVATVDRLLGEGGRGPTVRITAGSVATGGKLCGGEEDAPDALDATITEVSIAESDVGDVLRITFDGLPPDTADPQLLHVTLGAVELVARYQGGPTVDFPATLTHDEARLLADRLTP